MSTGEAAHYLGVCRNCVVRNIELRGKFIIQPRKTPRSHRRIPVSEVIEYMTRNGMTVPEALAALA